ncbi:MAG: hypothetical protein KGZ68_17995 [Dechloromonas sp.]|uniref:hypothetical protein n=1 Tax=Dechloromonas sp. CZR5 TaxID=2608630 RepID=UPI00123DDF07|nr:hypothetical protein [Dechloromonas sp. CZR5]MBS4020120.1 hypothetical protein [Dechloromonas sp.]
MNQKLLALYGLKWNPFSPEVPTEAIYVPPRVENFCWRIEHAQIKEGGFAMIHGDPGTGKSVALRLLASARFDSQPLLCIVLAGDARLSEKLRREELIPLGSRIRTRLATEHASRDELLACLDHLTAGAGNAALMTPSLKATLCDHAAGNYRILTTLAAELLAAAAQRESPQLDEKLYLEVFAPPERPASRRPAAGR